MSDIQKSWRCRGDCKLVFDQDPGAECANCFSSAGFDQTAYCRKHTRVLDSATCPLCESEKPLTDRIPNFASARWGEVRMASHRLAQRGRLALSIIKGSFKDRSALHAQKALGEAMSVQNLGDPSKLSRLTEIRNESLTASPTGATVAERDGLLVSIAKEAMLLPTPPSPGLAIPHLMAINAAKDLAAHTQAAKHLRDSLGAVPEAERAGLFTGYCLIGVSIFLGFVIINSMVN